MKKKNQKIRDLQFQTEVLRLTNSLIKRSAETRSTPVEKGHGGKGGPSHNELCLDIKALVLALQDEYAFNFCYPAMYVTFEGL